MPAREKARGRAATSIQLKPEETGLLSLVAEYAGLEEAKPVLEGILRSASPRTRAIGRLLLDGPQRRKAGPQASGKYQLVAETFREAHANNVRYGRVLDGSTPPGLWTARGGGSDRG